MHRQTTHLLGLCDLGSWRRPEGWTDSSLHNTPQRHLCSQRLSTLNFHSRLATFR